MRKREIAGDDAFGWLRIQGRTNARLLLLAREIGAEFVPPADAESFGAVRGRLGGCVFELRVVDDAGHQLEVELRHHASSVVRALSGEGLTPPALDPARVRSALEANCYAFATRT